MKKVLLTSAVVLAAFGAVQSVSAADDYVDYNSILASIRSDKAKADAQAVAQHIYDVQDQQLSILTPAYNLYKEKDAAYNTLSSRVKEAYSNLEKLQQEKIRTADLIGDGTALVRKADELKSARTEAAQREAKFTDDVESYENEVNTAKQARVDAVKVTAAAEAAFQGALTSGDDTAIAQTRSNLALAKGRQNAAVKAEKEANEKLAKAEAELQKAVFDQARIEAALQYMDALETGNDYKITQSAYNLDKKIENAKETISTLESEVEVARTDRDNALLALENAEKRAAVEYKKVGLTYSRSILEEADAKANAVETGWKNTDKGWIYIVTPKGDKATGWKLVDGAWYYFNAEGVMQKWWIKDGNTWYYLNGSGEMQTGWLQDGGKWYFLENTGAMKTSQWFQVKDKWYHVDASGALSVNTTVDGYTVNGNGEWVN